MTKIKLQIKNCWTGKILFEYEKENNTIKDTVVEAVSRGADLSDADLRGAYLRGADLRDADLRDADLRGAYLRGADLSDAKNMPHIPIACPTDGAFVGWKKLNGMLVKLLIPEDARRCSAAGRKCRCDKAQVLAITFFDGSDTGITEILNKRQKSELLYKVGEMVYPDSFDEDRWHECTNGIHFFIDKQEAIDY